MGFLRRKKDQCGLTLQSPSFIDYLGDMYSDPSEIKFRIVRSGSDGVQQDIVRMRSYFQKAIESYEEAKT